MNADEMGAAFVNALPKIADTLANNQGAFVATVTQAGTVRVVLSGSELQK